MSVLYNDVRAGHYFFSEKCEKTVSGSSKIQKLLKE